MKQSHSPPASSAGKSLRILDSINLGADCGATGTARPAGVNISKIGFDNHPAAGA